ncbi:MAG: protease SohB, partial [Gammaproteobacteria bacterium]
MTEFLLEYGLFLTKSVTVLVILLVLLSAAAAVASRQRRSADQGRIEVRSVNDRIDDMRDALNRHVLDPKRYRKAVKAEVRARKKEATVDRRRMWVIHFDGDLQANAVAGLRQEITAILSLAREGDEVLACVESPGGMVHGYGLAASQLHRIRSREGLTLTVAVDKVAASGGYLMACLGHRILAAPFAVVGSIGVVAQIPNVHRLLKRNDIDVEVLTAGEYKRTLTVFGQNTEEGRAK